MQLGADSSSVLEGKSHILSHRRHRVLYDLDYNMTGLLADLEQFMIFLSLGMELMEISMEIL